MATTLHALSLAARITAGTAFLYLAYFLIIISEGDCPCVPPILVQWPLTALKSPLPRRPRGWNVRWEREIRLAIIKDHLGHLTHSLDRLKTLTDELEASLGIFLPDCTPWARPDALSGPPDVSALSHRYSTTASQRWISLMKNKQANLSHRSVLGGSLATLTVSPDLATATVPGSDDSTLLAMGQEWQGAWGRLLVLYRQSDDGEERYDEPVRRRPRECS